MITIKFQSLSNYEKQETDEEQVTALFENLQSTYPTLFQDEEVVIDVKVDQDPHTLDKIITVVGFIPKHGKMMADAQARTFSQALSIIKEDLFRYGRKQLG